MTKKSDEEPNDESSRRVFVKSLAGLGAIALTGQFDEAQAAAQTSASGTAANTSSPSVPTQAASEYPLNVFGSIADLSGKMALVHQALLNSGVPRHELASVTVTLLLRMVSTNLGSGPVVRPADALYTNLNAVQSNVDRGMGINLAATALVGAAL